METSARRVTFGIKTSQLNLGYDEILRVWREADEVPAFEHAWLWDHMVPMRGDVNAATLEAWTLLSALAAQTSRLRLGVIVTSNRLRHPALLAKMAATVDIISGGRLEFGIGAGGSRVPDPQVLAGVHREYDAYGVDVVAPSEALAALEEACTIAKRMWSETEPFDFDGRCYRLRGAICEPKPVQQPHPPILIGAGGERIALRVVAQHADIWNCPTSSVDEFRHKSAVLDEHCRAIGRDPSEIRRSVQVLVSSESQPERPAHLPPVRGPAEVRDALVELIDAGVSHVVLAALPPIPPVRWLADEIVEPVLARVRSTGEI
jgi:alkanesulfonate monooxygenase SsuD/methylene tetrahydromethanopterin reductase-like flavin-dependent oxidoreductase (luciferase family)